MFILYAVISRLGLKTVILSFLIVASASLSVISMYAIAQEDPRNPGLVNKLVNVFDTPGLPNVGLKPGDKGEFKIQIVNPYEGNMTNIVFNASIYSYATLEEIQDVTSAWTTPFVEESSSIEYSLQPFNLNTSEDRNVTFTIVTSYDTPHGGAFTQSTYFMRLQLEFDYTNLTGTEHLIMKSPGHFSTEVWMEATRTPEESDEPYYRGMVNLTYLREQTGQIDGILPDSSFSLKEQIPVWPFYAVIALMIISGFLAFMFYLEEKPGTWPWMERRWLGFKGKIVQVFRLSRPKKKTDLEPKEKGTDKKAK